MSVRSVATTVLLLLASASARAGLEIQAVEPANGLLWPARSGPEFYTTDTLCFRYYVAGARTGPDGLTDVETTVEMKTGAGDLVLFKAFPPRKLPAGNRDIRFRDFFWEPLQGNVPAGRYTLTATVRDNVAKAEATFSRPVIVKPVDFAIRTVEFYRDAQHLQAAPPSAAVAEDVETHIGLIGARVLDGKSDVEGTLEILAPDGAVLVSRSVSCREVPPPGGSVWMDLGFKPPWAGVWTIRYRATDRLSSKTVGNQTTVRVAEP
jgi:hypothetical protein